MEQDDEEGRTEATPLSVRQAYLAMYYFIDEYWKEGGERDTSLTMLWHDVGPQLDPLNSNRLRTTDPGFWSRWLEAVVRAREEGVPDQL